MANRLWSWTAEILSLDEVSVPEQRDLLAVWNRTARGLVPDQKKLPWSEIAPISPNLALLTLREKPLRARYRLVGRSLVKLLGSDPTGNYIHEVYPLKISDEVYSCFQKCIDTKEPVYFRREFSILGKSFGYHRLVLPLRLGTPDISRILICIYPTDRNLKEASQWKPVVEELQKLEEAERRFEKSWLDSLGDE